MKRLQHLALDRAVHVDEQIAARHHVEPRKRWIAQDVVRREQHLFAQWLVEHVAAFRLREEAPQTRGRHVGDDRVGIGGRARDVDRALVDVGGEDLQDRRRVGAAERFGKEHRVRIRLFARRAAGHPHANLLVMLLAFEDRRHDVAPDRFERVAVAKEIRHADQHVAQQVRRFLGVFVDEVPVSAQVRERVDLHATLDAPQHRRALVVMEVVAGAGAQRGEDPAQQVLGVLGGAARGGDQGACVGEVGQPDGARVAPQLDQLLRHRRDREHEVGLPRRDRALRHFVVFGVVGGLRRL